MNRDDERRLREIIRHSTNSPEIYEVLPDEDLADRLRLDSLTALEVLAVIEKKFGIMLPDDKLHELRTLHRIQVEIDRYTEEFGREGETICASD